jgi:hypothetical protein
MAIRPLAAFLLLAASCTLAAAQPSGGAGGTSAATGTNASGNTGSATGTSPSTSGGGLTGVASGRGDSMGTTQGPNTGGGRQILRPGQIPEDTKKKK